MVNHRQQLKCTFQMTVQMHTNTKSTAIESLWFVKLPHRAHRHTNWKVRRALWFQRVALTCWNSFCTWTFRSTIRFALWHKMRRAAFCESKYCLFLHSICLCILNVYAAKSQSKWIQLEYCVDCSSNPKKRYELFLKATQLDVIIEKLDGCLHQTNTAKIKYKAQQRQHDNYTEIQKKAHEKLKQFQSMEPLKVNQFEILFIAQKCSPT